MTVLVLVKCFREMSQILVLVFTCYKASTTVSSITVLPARNVSP